MSLLEKVFEKPRSLLGIMITIKIIFKTSFKTSLKLYRFTILISQRDLHHSLTFTYLLMVSRLNWVSITYVTIPTQIPIGTDTRIRRIIKTRA
jgi:hypothetical protein